MTECACANYVRKSHARPPRRWPRAKSDSFNVILKYPVSLPPSAGAHQRTYVMYEQNRARVMTFPIFDLPLDPRTLSLTFHRRTWTGVNCPFFFQWSAQRARRCRAIITTLPLSAFFLSFCLLPTFLCASVRGDPANESHILPRDASKDPPTNPCNASAILEDSLPPSDHFRYNRYRFEYRVDKLFCWHLCLREMSSRHPRDRRAKVVYQLHTSRNRCNPRYDEERFQIPHRFLKDIKYNIKVLN